MENINDINILLDNCQGLQNRQKRQDVFHYLKDKNFNIYALQDTHFMKEQESKIRSEWVYECLFSSFTSNSRGVAFLFNNNFDYKISNTYNDNEGNYFILDLIIEQNTRVTLVNIIWAKYRLTRLLYAN